MSIFGYGYWRKFVRRNRETLTAYVFLLPTIIFFGSIIYFPIAYSFFFSFFEGSVIGERRFVGLDNYFYLFKDRLFRQSMLNTFYFTAFIVILEVVISLGVALLLNRERIKFGNFFKMVYFIPVVSSLIAVALLWKWMYEPRFGFFNYVLSFIGIRPRAWLLSENTAMSAVILTIVWKNVGLYIIIFLAGLKGISKMYKEAASVDGATEWQVAKYITLPLLKPVTFLVITFAMIRGWLVFPEVYVMTEGGPVNSTRVMVFEIWEKGFLFFKMGIACAESYVLFSVILLITFIQRKLLKE